MFYWSFSNNPSILGSECLISSAVRGCENKEESRRSSEKPECTDVLFIGLIPGNKPASGQLDLGTTSLH